MFNEHSKRTLSTSQKKNKQSNGPQLGHDFSSALYQPNQAENLVLAPPVCTLSIAGFPWYPSFLPIKENYPRLCEIEVCEKNRRAVLNRRQRLASGLSQRRRRGTEGTLSGRFPSLDGSGFRRRPGSVSATKNKEGGPVLI